MNNTTSLLPLDVGFDLRLHDYTVDLAPHLDQWGLVDVLYVGPDDKPTNTGRVRITDAHTMLLRAGYSCPWLGADQDGAVKAGLAKRRELSK
jgi:hypothetical protein